MYCVFILASLIITSSNCEPTNTIIPCHRGDVACMTASANAAVGKFVDGFPELGVPASDPLLIDEINGDLATLKFKFTNTTVTGFKNCQLSDVNLNIESLSMNYVLHCKNIVLKGQYTISGQLIILPVEGNGDYELISKLYEFKIDANLKEVKGKDGKQHYAAKDYKFKANPLDNIVYDFKNLFNGQKELADAVLKFSNENWKDVADFVQEPVINAIMKKIIHNINKYLKVIPAEDLLLN